MEKEEEEIFIPDKDAYKPYSLGSAKYRRCPICKEHREFPTDFVPEGPCVFCVEDVWEVPELFKRYLKTIKKGYIQPVLDMEALFFKN